MLLPSSEEYISVILVGFLRFVLDFIDSVGDSGDLAWILLIPVAVLVIWRGFVILVVIVVIGIDYGDFLLRLASFCLSHFC